MNMKKPLLAFFLVFNLFQSMGANANQTLVTCSTYSGWFHQDENRLIVISPWDSEMPAGTAPKDVQYRLWVFEKDHPDRWLVTFAVTKEVTDKQVTFSSLVPPYNPEAKLDTLTFSSQTGSEPNQYSGDFTGTELGDPWGTSSDMRRQVKYKVRCSLSS